MSFVKAMGADMDADAAAEENIGKIWEMKANE